MTPICGAREYDSVCVHTRNGLRARALPDPPATEVVNSAITLFAAVFPSQSPKVQEFVLEQLITHLSAGALQRAPGRRAAVAVNTAIALLGALKVAVGEISAEPGDLKNPAVEKALQVLLGVGLKFHSNSLLRANLESRTFLLIPTSIYATSRMKPWVDFVIARGIHSQLSKSTL